MNLKTIWVLLLINIMITGIARSNNLLISNVSVEEKTATTAYIKFDISWDNSWRYEVDNDPLYLHDAAWVFFKVQPELSTQWKHVKLVASGTDPLDFGSGTGTGIELVIPDDRTGLFIRRNGSGSGRTAVEGVQVVWNLAESGVTKRDQVRIQAFAVEMVYVASGGFYLGDGLTDQGQFLAGGVVGDPEPYYVGSAGVVNIGNDAGELWGASTSGNNRIGVSGTTNADYPNGFDAFYCMKYLITQGQYADFLNALSREHQREHCSITNLNYYMSDKEGGSASASLRGMVKMVEDSGPPLPRVYRANSPDYACNYFSWADMTAFADWAGLRPMTELEYEKACRGPLQPVAGEYAWGSVNVLPITGNPEGVDGSGSEYYPLANLHYNLTAAPNGPIRVGAFAHPESLRENAGASYWGIMDLSGNLYERCVNICTPEGRGFTGQHGDGELTLQGQSNVSGWPGANATGSGVRGGAYSAAVKMCRVSDRYYAFPAYTGRIGFYGGRVVRSAP